MGFSVYSDLSGISAFVHTVETGSFTAAAARMGLTKSAVGKNVARLEERLGIRLLNRTTRSIRVTPEGETYYASCLRILDELNNVEAQLASQKAEVSGRLRINIPVSFGRLWVIPVLHRVAKSHPKLSLDVTFADRLVDLVEEGIDLVVRIGPPGDQASLQGRPIGTQRWTVCASRDYLESRGRPRRVDELSHHDCLVFAREGRARAWTISTPEGVEEVRVQSKYTICHGEALRDAALLGMGLAYLPTWLIHDDLQTGRLESVFGGQPVETEQIHVLWPSSRTLAPKARVVVDALKNAFLPNVPWEA